MSEAERLIDEAKKLLRAKRTTNKTREQFRAFERRQKERGVVFAQQFPFRPSSKRETVGSTYGKTREQILREQRDER